MAVFAVPSNKAHVVSNKQFEAMKRPDAETIKRTEKAAVRFAARCILKLRNKVYYISDNQYKWR